MMKDPALICRNEQRRQSLRDENERRREAGEYLKNGLDYLEVSDDQLTLTVYFLGKAPEKVNEEEKINEENVRIEGGRRIRGIRVVRVRVRREDDPDLDDYMEVVVDRPGDFSTYTLRVVEMEEDFDPRYARLEFSFKAGCPSDLDCKTEETCPPPEYGEPEINYLAKDYASFRQLILDRLSLVMPDWHERHVPDLGIALVEVLAYVGDHLSYYQDAVATEAYLETARQRVSVRRHTRLVDYRLHEGCNARAWIVVRTERDETLDPRDIYFIAGNSDSSENSRVLAPEDLRNVPSGRYKVFEPLLEEHFLFRPSDLKNPAGLARKLRSPPDRLSLLSRYLLDRLSEDTRRLLERYEHSETLLEVLRQALIDELNQLLEDEGLYDKRRFREILLTEETRKLVKRRAQGEDSARLNRLLLEDAYPEEIVKSNRLWLYEAHNEILFYTWGDSECCLPRGATKATLKDAWVGRKKSKQQEPRRRLRLKEGDFLIFEEVIGPKTGNPADADLARRHAVRLTRVTLDEDDLFGQPIVEIEWAHEDALPFPLCLSTIGPDCDLIEDVSVARGNVILADHGETLGPEDLEIVQEAEAIVRCEDECHPAETVVRPERFRPRLEERPLTFSQQLPAGAPASGLLAQDPHLAIPRIEKLIGTRITPDGVVDAYWTAQPDLLGSQSQDRHFVVELDNEGRAHLRFGDGELGRMPEAGTTFRATYRVGNGPSGNVGAGTITYIVFRRNRRDGLRPRNPLPAWGGTAPEPLAEARLSAPGAFRTNLQRAITADDYARLAERHPKVQKAAATLHWTGSWYEVLVAIDPRADVELQEGLAAATTAFADAVRQTALERYLDMEELRTAPGGEMAERVAGALEELWTSVERNAPPDRLVALVNEKLKQLWEDRVTVAEEGYGRLEPQIAKLAAELEHAVSVLAVRDVGAPAGHRLLREIWDRLYPYRRIGHDLAVAWARYVALDIEMEVCVRPDFLRGHIKAALLGLFGNRALPDGRRGFFHPDNLTFGDGIFLSRLIATAQAVPGVESVGVTTLERLFEGPNGEIEAGVLPLGPLEIARLDNDPDFPENGRLRLQMRGGR